MSLAPLILGLMASVPACTITDGEKAASSSAAVGESTSASIAPLALRTDLSNEGLAKAVRELAAAAGVSLDGATEIAGLDDIKTLGDDERKVYAAALEELATLWAALTRKDAPADEKAASRYMVNVMEHCAEAARFNRKRFAQLVHMVFSAAAGDASFEEKRARLGTQAHRAGSLVDTLYSKMLRRHEIDGARGGFNLNVVDSSERLLGPGSVDYSSVTHHFGELMLAGFNVPRLAADLVVRLADTPDSNAGDVRNGHFAVMLGDALAHLKITPSDAVELVRWAYLAESPYGVPFWTQSADAIVSGPLGTKETFWIDPASYDVDKWLWGGFDTRFTGGQIDGFAKRRDRAQAAFDRYKGAIGAAFFGPERATIVEEYAGAPGRRRLVKYSDKGRLELGVTPAFIAGTSAALTVTSGLLTKELVSGMMQIGDNTYERRKPAEVSLAGDPNGSITYATFGSVCSTSPSDKRSPDATNTLLRNMIDRAGHVSHDAPFPILIKRYESALGHNLPDIFATYLDNPNNVGDWLTTVGYPISEPFWTPVTVAGHETTVLIQAFERRVLTFTPTNPRRFRSSRGTSASTTSSGATGRLPFRCAEQRAAGRATSTRGVCLSPWSRATGRGGKAIRRPPRSQSHHGGMDE